MIYVKERGIVWKHIVNCQPLIQNHLMDVYEFL